MAAQQPDGINFLQQVLQDAALRSAINAVVEPTLDFTTDAMLEDDITTNEQLAYIQFLSINLATELPDQKVTVEYLQNSQKMIIPLALGINPVTGAPGRAPRQEALIATYWKLTRMNYTQLRALFTPSFDPAQIKATVDAMNVVPGAVLFEGWNDPAFYDVAEARDDPVGFPDQVFSAISSALQFNCDIRDLGYLNTPDSGVDDGGWKHADAVPFERLRVKLHELTLNYMAALNLPAVGNEPLAAFVRSYGIAIGILPSLNSAMTKEYKFDAKMPKPDELHAINAFHKSFEGPLVTPCAQILAMFGLMHLAKDHTFRTGDAEMMRIGTSYVNALRTEIPANVLDRIKQNMEPFVRTAPLPFGLGQTYWLARVLGVHGKLASPLAVRLDVTPPPVQRLMIAYAARKEWLGLPAGHEIDAMYTSFYPGIESERARILKNPPAFSELHRLYGIEHQDVVDQAVMQNVQSMMPTVCGYVMIAHKGDHGKADGLALAPSLKNVRRKQKGLVRLWESVWAKCINAVDESGNVEFVQHMQRSVGQSSSS